MYLRERTEPQTKVVEMSSTFENRILKKNEEGGQWWGDYFRDEILINRR